MSKDYLVTFLSHGIAGEQIANTISVHDDELGGTRDVDTVIDHMDTWLSAKYKACINTNTIYDVLRCFRIPDTYGDDSNVASKALGVAGLIGSADGLLGREATLTLALRSLHTSRRKMGRLSMPSPCTSAALNSDGTWKHSHAYWVAVTAFADQLLAGHDIGIGGIDGHLSARIYSRKQHKTGSGDKTTDIKSYTLRPRPRWLRRRVSIP